LSKGFAEPEDHPLIGCLKLGVLLFAGRGRGIESQPKGSQFRRVADMAAGTISRPWRRYLRFSLRGLIVVVIVIGVGLGWMVRTIRSARIQREAVAAVRTYPGYVFYDWEWSNGVFIRGGRPWAPKWLIDLIGIDFFGNVTNIGLSRSSVAPNAVIAAVGNLSGLQRLSLSGTSVADGDLAHLTRLTDLSDLFLANTKVSDAGLAHLEGLNRLSSLELHDTPVTDAGLVHLQRLTGLRNLCLAKTPVTDGGLAHLNGLTKLSVLNVMYTRVSGTGANHLKQALPSLTIHH
jgi:hypothetical protein